MIDIQTPEKLGEKNRKAIVELLKHKGPLSRADISRSMGLSFPAVSSNVNYLIENQYIIETGEGNNSMGRKSTLLEFNSKKGYVVGIDLGRLVIRLKISDLLGNSIVTLSSEVNPKSAENETGNKLTSQLIMLVEEAIKKAGIEKKDILSVGVGIPGIIEKESGKIFLAPYMHGWNDINIYEAVRQIFDCRITIENSVSLGAIGEKWKGCGTHCSNLVYISYAIGIGSALIINNELYTGKDGVAGEIGFAIVSPALIRNEYNEAGSLEQLISGSALDTLVKESGLGVSSLKELFKLNSPQAIAKKEEILENIEKHFGVLLVTISSIINPETIVLSGGIGSNVGRLLIPRWKKIMEANLPFPPKLVCSEMGSEANVYGALRYALNNIDDIYCAWN